METNDLKEFINDCISSGRCESSDKIDLTQEQMVGIDDILHRFNDKTARTKIRKVLTNGK